MIFKVHPLIGKYVFITSDEYYKYGKITDNIDEELFLVQIFLRNESKLSVYTYSLYNINQMIQDDGERIIGWQFFKNKAALNKYIKWIDTPTENPENKVLQLVKKNEVKI